jgi:hypothetical protein
LHLSTFALTSHSKPASDILGKSNKHCPVLIRTTDILSELSIAYAIWHMAKAVEATDLGLVVESNLPFGADCDLTDTAERMILRGNSTPAADEVLK